MTDLTAILSQIDQGDPSASDRLLPLLYNELRQLAAAKLAREKSGNSLQPTALVHDAYLRLVGSESSRPWNGRAHFFGAAAEAMRRILVERARRRSRVKHGGDRSREDVDLREIAAPQYCDDLLALDEALQKLAACDPQAAELVNLRYFAGLTIPEAAELLEISPRKANSLWAFSRAWLRSEIEEPDGRSE